MLLVVVGHNQILMGQSLSLVKFIYLFHMPLFFFISGITLKPDQGLTYYFTRAINVIAVYFVFSFLVLPFVLMKNPDDGVINIVLGILYGTGHTIEVAPLWFIPCLFFSIVLVGLALVISNHFNNTDRESNRSPIFFLALLFIGVGVFLINSIHYYLIDNLAWGSLKNSGMIWSIDIAIIGAGFILLGMYAKVFVDKYKITEIKSIYLIVSIVCAIFVMLGLFSFGVDVDLNFRKIAHYPLAMLCMILGIFFSILFSIFLDKYTYLSTILSSIGKSTLLILLFHNAIQNHLICTIGDSKIYSAVIGIVIAILIPIVLDKFVVNKYELFRKIVYPKLSINLASKIMVGKRF